MNMNMKTRFVNDLGVAAYLLMHGYVVVGKKARSIYFEVPDDDTDFDRLVLEYQPPNEFYTFDSCLMYLKKINELIMPDNLDQERIKTVTGLGVGAYILLQEYRQEDKRLKVKVVGKKGKYVYFYVPEGRESAFERLIYQYLPSPFKTYDSNLMALKEHGEYMPLR